MSRSSTLRMGRGGILAVALVTFVALAILAGMTTADAPAAALRQPASAQAWTIECVDCPRFFTLMGQRSLRLDAAGRPHVAYGGDHLYYAWYDGAAWHTETADNAGSVGRYASLALDAAGYPHISYYDLANKDLKYTRWTGTTWSTQTVDSAGDVGQYGALALDAAGAPHIGYYDNTNGHPKYAAWTGSAWTIQTVDSAPMGGWCTVPLARPNTCACERASHPTSGLSLVTPSSSRSWAVILKSTTCWLSIWCLTRKGNIKTLPPKGEFHCELEMGTLVPAEAKRLEEKVSQIAAG